MNTTAQYQAADERARDARRAGLQAKKDEQPANTARSYAAKQKEWKKWCLAPRVAEDGTSYSWPDGELVMPDKLAAWLKEDILLRRVPPKKPRAPRKARSQQQQQQQEAKALAKAKALSKTLEVPLAEAVELLVDDRDGYIPPASLARVTAMDEEEDKDDKDEGTLLSRGTVDAYVVAVIELWRL
jgi:hypothetical protein